MRNRTIDVNKGILVCLMIYAHCLQFFVDFEIHKGMHMVSETINLIAFSGFVFAFGFTSFYAYLQQDRDVSGKHMLKNVFRLLIAFYISSFSYVVFVEKIPLRMENIMDIFLVKRLAGWSEFLLSFAFIMLFNVFLSQVKDKITNRVLICMLVLCVLSSLLQNGESTPVVGTIWGGRGAPFFPCIPYGFYFFAGIYLAKNQELQWSGKVLSIAVLGTLFYYISWIAGKNQPSRFPLSIEHLVGASLFVYALFYVAGRLERLHKKNILCVLLENIGVNSIFYLLFSNLIIFSLTKTAFYKRTPLYCLGLAFVLILMIYYFTWITRIHKNVD